MTGGWNDGYISFVAPGCWARLAETTADSARIEPTDRSIPVEMMATVTPIARIAITETWRMTLIRFWAWRNVPFVSTARRATITTRIPMIAYFRT